MGGEAVNIERQIVPAEAVPGGKYVFRDFFTYVRKNIDRIGPAGVAIFLTACGDSDLMPPGVCIGAFIVIVGATIIGRVKFGGGEPEAPGRHHLTNELHDPAMHPGRNKKIGL